MNIQMQAALLRTPDNEMLDKEGVLKVPADCFIFTMGIETKQPFSCALGGN